MFLLVVALLFCYFCVAAPPRDSFSKAVGVQMHSVNDLREWDALLAKGVTHYKADAHWVANQTFCLTQRNVVREVPPPGCIVLSHDDPTVPFHRLSFNSSVDLVSKSGQLARLTRITVAVCFKYDGDYSSLCADASFLKHADWMIGKMMAVDNLTVVIDGAGTPVGARAPCLATRWQPLVSTFVPFVDPPGAILSNVGTFGRLQVLDIPVKSPLILAFRYVASVKYGKFRPERSGHDFYVWEPADAATINSVVRKFRQTGLMPTANPPKLRFASNLDPYQLMAYSAASTGRGWGQHLDVSSNFISAVPCGELLVVLTTNSTGHWGYLVLDTSVVLQTGDPFALRSQWRILGESLETPISMSSIHRVNNEKYVIMMSDRLGSYRIFELSPSGTLSAISQGKFNTSGVTFASSVRLFSPDSGMALIAGSTCLYVLQFNLTEISSATSRCVLKLPTNRLVSSVVFDVITGASGEYVGLGTLSSSSASFLFTFSSYSSFQISAIPSVAGVVSSIFISSTGNVQMVAVDGYCFNDEVRNKMATGDAVCDRRPTSEPGVLNYYSGPLSEFQRAVSLSLGLHACNSSILVGSFTVADPRTPAVLVPTSKVNDSFVVIHNGLSRERNSPICGAPLPHAGLQISGFSFFNL